MKKGKPKVKQFEKRDQINKDLDKVIVTKPIFVEKTPGRNDPCVCGSGKKFKQCCINVTPKKYF